MASAKIIGIGIQMLFDAPLANKPKATTEAESAADVIARTARIFGVTLRDLDDDLLLAAITHHIATQRWFPSVAELRECAAGLIERADNVPDPYTAWQQIKRALRGCHEQPHPLALQAINALGGLREFGQSNTEDEASWRARFVAAYTTYQRRQVEDAMMLPAISGYIEARRQLNGQSVAGMIGDATRRLSVGGGAS